METKDKTDKIVNILNLFDGLDESWLNLFISPEVFPILKDIFSQLAPDLDNITPPIEQIFTFARYPKSDVKVVIVGQDPYPTKGDAHGLAFSSLSAAIPASLSNIYKCLRKHDLLRNTPTTGNLSKWSKQGVLLLNIALTTRIGESNVHSKIWSPFTAKIIENVSESKNVIFLLWGNFAQATAKYIKEGNEIMMWRHPSPLAQRVSEEKQFINCDHFVRVNDIVKKNNIVIDWDPNIAAHVIYTDGGCDINGKIANIHSKAGYAAYFTKGPFAGYITYGKVKPAIVGNKTLHPTNQRAEGEAILVALSKCRKYDIIELVTDSEYWMKMINVWMPSWESKNIPFDTKKNPDLSSKIHELAKEINRYGKLHIKHIKSHGKDSTADKSDVQGNKIADIYANLGKGLKDYVAIEETIPE